MTTATSPTTLLGPAPAGWPLPRCSIWPPTTGMPQPFWSLRPGRPGPPRPIASVLARPLPGLRQTRGRACTAPEAACKNASSRSRQDIARASRHGTIGTCASMSLRLKSHSLTIDRAFMRRRGQDAALSGSARVQRTPPGTVKKNRRDSPSSDSYPSRKGPVLARERNWYL